MVTIAKNLLTVSRFNGGVADSCKEGVTGSFYFATNLNIFSEPSQITLNPKTIKDSSDVVTGLVKWIVSGIPHDTNTYFYDDGGKIYQRTSAGVWSTLQTTANSDGQGLEVHNDYLYYTQRTQIGRYGLLSGTPTFTDNWQTGLNNTSSTKFAPIKAFKEGFAVGNGNDLGWWDSSVWDQDRVVLPIGFEIRSLDIIDEYLAIGAWRGTSITDSEESYIFFWDGTATVFNFFIKSEEGAVNALLNSKNRLFSVLGSSGGLFLNFAPLQKVYQIPKLPFGKYVEVYPGAVTVWKNIVHFGVAGSTDDTTNLVQGVYQYGSKSDRYPETLNMGYTISTGTQTGSNLKIGAAKGIGDELYIGWRDGSSYGVDRVLQTSNPFASGTMEFLVFDNNVPMMDKLADSLKASHLALVSGESVQIGYKTDRESSYTTGGDNVVGDVTTKLPVKSSKARFHEFQFETVLATTGSTSPTLTGISLAFDDLIEEISGGKK